MIITVPLQKRAHYRISDHPLKLWSGLNFLLGSEAYSNMYLDYCTITIRVGRLNLELQARSLPLHHNNYIHVHKVVVITVTCFHRYLLIKGINQNSTNIKLLNFHTLHAHTIISH